MKSIADLWTQVPKSLVLTAGASLFFLLAWIDFRTGMEIAFSIFYWIPIAAVTWRAGRTWGVAFSFASAVARLWTDWHSAVSVERAPFIVFNFVFWFVSFGILCLLLAKLHELLEFQAAMANTDHTTGMPNARAFEKAITKEIVRSRRTRAPFSLAYLDVDDLKGVNDRFGHQSGDQLLQSMAPASRSVLRAADVMARIGGDEFAILLPSTGQHEARAAMERLRGNLAGGAALKYKTTVSIGLITVRGGNRTAEELLHIADSLMYEVKASGKNNLVHAVLGPKE